jgi:hypothetical protein
MVHHLRSTAGTQSSLPIELVLVVWEASAAPDHNKYSIMSTALTRPHLAPCSMIRHPGPRCCPRPPDAVMKEDGACCRVRRRPQASMAKVSMPWRANPLRSRPPSPPPAARNVANAGVRIAGSHGDGSRRFLAEDSSREKFNGASGSLRSPVSLGWWQRRLLGSSRRGGRWAVRSDEIVPGQG